MNKFSRDRVKGFLRTEGTRIVNGDGDEVILQGFGAGNWTNPEGFMVGAPKEIKLVGDIFSPDYIPPRRLDRRWTFDLTVRELCGSAYAEAFWGKWHRNHLAEADIKEMAAMGLNSVRLPLNSDAFLKEEPGLVWDEDGFAMLDDVIDWCEKHRVYAILDMHSSPGGQSGTACDGGYDNRPHLFIDEESWDRALALWERLAIRYKDRWIVGGYDLLNEPVNTPNFRHLNSKLAEFYEAAIAVIRKHDKNHMFTLEGPQFSRATDIFNRQYDPECNNWVIHIHLYGPSPEKQSLAWYIKKSQDYNVPIWIGEGGSYSESNAAFYEICADYGVGFNLWCWKTAKDGPFPGNSVQYHLPKDWEAVRGYANGGPKPGYEKSQAIFNELLENIKFENCAVNREHIRITRRSPDLMLPAVSYDNLPGDGKSYCGTWDHGNVLGFRLSDRTKLILAPGIDDPVPGFEMFEVKDLPRPHDPLKTLMIELAEGEFATYTVRDVKTPCAVAIESMSPDGAAVLVTSEAGDSYEYEIKSDSLAWQETITLKPGIEHCVKVLVNSGTAQVKMIHFRG